MKGFISKVKDKGSEIKQKVSNKPNVLSVDSTTEGSDMKEATRNIEQTHASLTATKKAYDKYQRSFVSSNNDHRVASDSLKNFSVQMKDSAQFAVLSEFVDKVATFSEQLQQISATLNQDMCAQLLTPLEGVLEGDLAEAEFSKKRFNKVLSDYDNITKKIAGMKGGGNPQKLAEAQKEQEQLQQKFEVVGGQTMQTLNDVNNRVEFAMFQTLHQYVETYHLFFSRGSALIEEVSNDLAKYKVFSEKKREVVEAGGVAESVRLEDIAGNEGSTAPRDALERSVMELIEKERSYVRKLDTISKSYIQNIRVDDQLAARFTDDICRTVFCNVEELLAMHKCLVSDLEVDMQCYPNYNTGQILSNYVPRFRSYIQYISNYSQALNALDLVENRSQQVKKFMRTMDRKNGLRGLLSEPTNRISIYIIGLTQILKQLHPSSDERTYISDVIDDLTKLVGELQEAQNVSNNIGTMLPVYNDLALYPGNLLEPSRVLQKECMLDHHFTTPEGKQKSELTKFYICTDVVIQAKKRSVLAGIGNKDEDSFKKFNFVRSFLLEGAAVDLLPDNEETNMLNGFELREGSGGTGGSLIVCCTTAQERTDLILMLEDLITGNITNAVFEVPLDVCMANQRDQSLDLPEVVLLTTDYLLKYGLDVEGIFRMSGSKREIGGIIAKFNRGENVVLENETADEHTVAGLLKHWVRHLPEPLLTYQLTENFLACENDFNTLRANLQMLPDINLRTISLLFYVLSQVAAKSELNKMDSKNLAIVFAPGLLKREGASDFDTSHYEQAYAVIGYMVDNYQDLFEGMTSVSSSMAVGNITPANARPSSPMGGFAPPKPKKQLSSGPRSRGGSNPKRPSNRAPSPNRSPSPQQGGAPAGGAGTRMTPSNSFSQELNSKMAARSLPPGPEGRAPSSPSPPPQNPGGSPMKGSPKKGLGKFPKAPDHQAPVKRRNSVLKNSGEQGKLTRSGSMGGRDSESPPPSSRPPCARCNEPIRGAGLKALGAAWHKDCFVCTHCQQPFAGKILQKDGQPYCEQDFRKLFGGGQAKICRACNQKISGPFMKALGGFWHADHFLCRNCGGSVSEGYYEKDDYPYCSDCFAE